ncbi:hypothetical protein PHISCL_09929 [Aspergillus sclerotialis]|uniref:F-box domain protein n=1 Tax=Aspergillus sclerotialis TaxID=2070753 RepID=A0A3A2ZIN2_9EURO|nr:hypothetical protein PHISCL_09929 [Aspergillus sclerotialis]
MSTNFLSLPPEIRCEIYKYLLVHKGYFCLFYRGGDQELASNILCTNKMIFNEARSLLYGHNRFDFTTCKSDFVFQFLDQIGRHNASYIRYMRIEFPYLCDLDSERLILEYGIFRILAKIQSDCTNLRTAMRFNHHPLSNSFHLDDLLTRIATYLEKIHSRHEIIGEIYEDSGSAIMKREMEHRGWAVNVI